MPGLPKYYLVDQAVMPEIFLKVVEAVRLLEVGEASSISDAVRMCNLSRSAFYKYKDSIKPFFSAASAKIVTFHLILVDAPGVLSGILRIFAEGGSNILTINQSIPINGVASVTISANTENMLTDIETLTERAGSLTGVAKIEIVAG